MTTPPCRTYVIEALEYAEGKTVTLYGVHLYGTVVYGNKEVPVERVYEIQCSDGGTN